MDKDLEIKQLKKNLNIAVKGLKYISGFHIRGEEDIYLEILRTKATETIQKIEIK